MDFSITSPTGARTIQITLPERGNVGILVSGGLDSSVMLAMILMTRMKENPNVPFIALNVKRGFGTERFSKGMIERMQDHFKMRIPLKHLDLPDDVPHLECLRFPIKPILGSGAITKVFSADTSNPFDHPQAPNRARLEDQNKSVRWGLPFLHCDKSHIVALMHDLELGFIEQLSHTCFAQDEYRCRTCFQCEERAWAFSTLGLTDSGEH